MVGSAVMALVWVSSTTHRGLETCSAFSGQLYRVHRWSNCQNSLRLAASMSPKASLSPQSSELPVRYWLLTLDRPLAGIGLARKPVSSVPLWVRYSSCWCGIHPAQSPRVTPSVADQCVCAAGHMTACPEAYSSCWRYYGLVRALVSPAGSPRGP